MALIGLLLVQGTATVEKYPRFEQQVLAAQIMAESLGVVREARLNRGIPIDIDFDPNQTGLIGDASTLITTTLGNLEAKRTSTTPALAALMVRLFYEAGLEKGSSVAIGASGSFPGLIIATLSACAAMELEPLLFYSVGASMYGANVPHFTFIEMLRSLQVSGTLPYEVLAVSLGSNNDRGEGMFFPESQKMMMEIARSASAQLIFPENNAESVDERLALYAKFNGDRQPDIFVNIGGASPNMGNTNASLQVPSGLVTKAPVRTENPERGLIFEYLDQGIPVIHLLNIKELALEWGIVVDPVPFPPIGAEDVYYVTGYKHWLSWGSVLAILATLFLIRKKSL
jgi:poly-gamma-glutamate system protein